MYGLVESEFGVTPVALAQTRRLLLAKQLLTGSTASMTEVALASGFASVRRFNHLLKVLGLRREKDMLAAAGTSFQQRVWKELCAIPYGETISYGELAKRIGQPTASRAVGLANGQNPISIVVPCHRVIGADGSLTGYGGGIERKRWLLAHEGAGSLI